MSIDAIRAGTAPPRSLQTTARFLIYTVTVGKRIVADCFSCRSRLEALIRQEHVWLYYRFNLSHRDIEHLLAERGITVSREAIRLWCIKFGAIYTGRLKRKHRGYGDTFYIDKVFVKINGKQHYLWRAAGQDGEVVDVYLQARRDCAAVKRFFRRLLRSHGNEPRKIVTDKLRSYGVAHRELIPETIHSTQ